MRQEGNKRDLTNCQLEIRGGRAHQGTLARAAEVMRQRALRDPEPDQALRMFGAGGGVVLAEYAAVEHWAAMKWALTQIHSFRNKKDVPMELLSHYQEAVTQYWRVRLTVEAEHAPIQQQYVAGKLDSYVKDATKVLRQHPQWRRAQR